MLASHNVSSHIYDNAQAADVATDIKERYMQPLSALTDFYQIP